MNFLRRLTVTQGLVIFGLLIALLLIGVIWSASSRQEPDRFSITNTPSINFDNFVTIEPLTATPES